MQSSGLIVAFLVTSFLFNMAVIITGFLLMKLYYDLKSDLKDEFNDVSRSLEELEGKVNDAGDGKIGFHKEGIK